MNNIYIDTHCHLDLFENISANPQSENTSNIISISVTNAPAFFDPNLKLFGDAKNIRVALGLHPELAQQYKDQVNVFENKLSETKYIGEIGLDGSLKYKSVFHTQRAVFEKILQLVAVADNKIISVHSRNAAEETVKLLAENIAGTNCKAILHWYSGDLKTLKKAIEIGCYFSINHKMVATEKGKEIIKLIPTVKLLTETDAPFTFDHKVKTRMQSLFETTKGLSQILNISPTQVQGLVYSNFRIMLS